MTDRSRRPAYSTWHITLKRRWRHWTPLPGFNGPGRDGLAGRDFTVQEIDAQQIARGDWFAVNFLSPFLVKAYRTLGEESPGAVPDRALLSDLADVGPAGATDTQTPTRVRICPPSRAAALSGITRLTSRSRCGRRPTSPKSSCGRRVADKYWEQRGPMLLPTQLRLNLARVAAVMLPESAVGSRWTPCHPHDPDIARALCLYLNSTLGLLSMLGARDNRVPSYPSFSLDTLRSVPVPDFAALAETEREMLSGWFDWLQYETLQPFPLMADDPVRAQIDGAVVQALALDAEWIADIRRHLPREPSVTNRRLE